MNEVIQRTPESHSAVLETVNKYRASVYQPPVKSSSIKQYIQNWNRLYTQISSKWGEDMPDNWYTDPEKVIGLINDMRDKRYADKVISISSRRNYLSALIQFGQCYGVCPDCIKEYSSYRSSMNKTLSGKGVAEDSNETADLTTREEVQTKVFDMLEANKYVWSCGMPVIQYYILMKLHMLHNLRNDCASLYWIKKKTFTYMPNDEKVKKNWLVMGAWHKNAYNYEIVLNDYKTKKETDTAVHLPIDKNIRKVLNTYLTKHWMKHYGEEFNDSPVFIKGVDNDIMNPLQSNDMTVILQKHNQMYLGKKIGTKMLRHSFYTEKYGGIAKELKEDAQNSLHSVGTAIESYTHPDDIEKMKKMAIGGV